MSVPLVSILIPCFNAERWVAQTLESALAQTWPNVEIVVVNDGSTDGSRAVLAQYESRGIRVVDQINAGQGAAMNRAIGECTGEYIQFLDADDLLAPDKIERQMRRLLEHPGCAAIAEWARFKADPREAIFAPHATWRDLDPVDWLVADWADGGGMMYPAMWLLPKAVVDAAGPWPDLTLAIDTEYFARVVLAARKVLFCPGARTYYRSGISGSQSGLKSTRGWQSQVEVLTRCEQHLLGREDSDRTRRVCSMLWQRFAHASYPYVPGLATEALRHSGALHRDALAPEGGRAFRIVSALFGWKLARRLQVWSGRP